MDGCFTNLGCMFAECMLPWTRSKVSDLAAHRRRGFNVFLYHERCLRFANRTPFGSVIAPARPRLVPLRTASSVQTFKRSTACSVVVDMPWASLQIPGCDMVVTQLTFSR
jgi:hypothetical protein